MISKKSATALNKLMIALRSIDKNSTEKGNGPDSTDTVKYNPAFEPFNMQRRNQKDRKIFLRCYFNAVSCF
ncbi:unnamed protein product [Allacma fusca]|uniref:Uncharacterized protein n=1 Tax=Allacma fusca TaxID=39272 RepID=A0A8J2JKR9_9HEXA|nr:unnamed protein product [Allacma fusca]